MKKISSIILHVLISFAVCSQTYTEWEEDMKTNYSVSIGDDAIYKTGILAAQSNFATINNSSSDSINAHFSSSDNSQIGISSTKKDTLFTDYFSIDFHEFLFKDGNFNGWELTGTILDLSSGNQKVLVEAETNVPVVIEIQLIDANGHVTYNDTHVYDTLYPLSIDTLIFKNFLFEDKYSQEWWEENNDRGEQSYFPEDAIIPVYDSKIVSARIFIRPLSKRLSSDEDILVTFHTVRIIANNPIVELPPQPHVTPHYDTKDTLCINDFFFDDNTSIEDITWSFSSSDPNVEIEYNTDKKIIGISNLSQPTTIDITATNNLGYSSTEQYHVYYVNALPNIAHTILKYNRATQKLTSDIISSGSFSCYSIIGSHILTDKIQNGSVDVSNLKNGMYIYKVQHQGEAYTGKFVK
ncbi:MAG: T9SS type A sorting domain-containing protein [Bacteroidales bacterium]